MEEALIEQDELAFAELTQQLLIKLTAIQGFISRSLINERMVIEASREAIITLTTLGITGFDSPSGLNNMAENKTVLESLQRIAKAYESFLTKAQNQQIATYFKIGFSYFKELDFDRFNRYGFIQDFSNPLYAYLLKIQKSLHIETRDLVYTSEFSVNYEAKNIFDTDFLNYAYFSQYSNSGITEHRQTLGKKLFYDPLFSHNNKRACASCHDSKKGFTDASKTSLAYDGIHRLKRNAPTLLNSVYNTRLFWDARATTFEEQVEHVLYNKDELNSNYDELIEKLSSCQEYVANFEEAYPSIGKINRYTVLASLSSYLQTLRSYNSPFDRGIREEEQITETKIIDGFNIFAGKGKCATCHFIPTFAGNVPPLYTDTETEVLGIPDTNDPLTAALDSDLGRYGNGRITENAEFYLHSIKTPSVRNVSLSAPYMHNGVFTTLREVVDFYNIGGGHGWGIAPENTTLPSDSLHLSETEIDALILFMEALSDTTNLTKKPSQLPRSTNEIFNDRKVGGEY
jgi:cytochrome c peroxidase